MMYFSNCNNLEELKKEYKKLAMQYHPDRPTGNLAKMQALNNEYDIVFPRLKDKHNSKRAEGSHIKETSADYKHIIDQIINCVGIEIEICGTWIWIDGDTKPHKEIFKKLGFHWSPNKKKWGWGEKTPFKGKRKSWTMDEIRDTYGSEKVETRSATMIN